MKINDYIARGIKCTSRACEPTGGGFGKAVRNYRHVRQLALALRNKAIINNHQQHRQ